MWNGVFPNASIDSLTETIKFAERRHQLLASNVANLDTPGYQTKDISVSSFQEALKDKIAADRPTVGGLTKATEIDGTAKEQAIKKIHESYENILYQDGSNVSMEQQATLIAKNQSMHSTAITILRHQLRQLQMAIGESVNV